MGMYGARPPGHRRRMLFGGNKALFRYNAGDSLAAATFTRGSTATYVDANGVIQTALSNVPRDGHYIGGARSLLIEGARTNSYLWSCDFTNVAWLKNGSPTEASATSIVSGQSARQFTCASTANTNMRQNLGTFANGQKDTISFIVENVSATVTTFQIRDETAGAPVCLVDFTWASHTCAVTSGTGTVGQVNLGNGRWLIWCTTTGTASGTGAAGNTRSGYCYMVGLAATTLSVIVHTAQFEANAGFPSSLIVTAAATISRATDLLFFPFNYTPFALTVYTKHIELGMGLAVSNGGLWSIGNGGTSPYLRCYSNVGGGQAYSVNANFTAGGSFSDITAALAIGDTVEVCAGVSGTGALSAVGRLSRNGGVDIVGGTGGAKTPDPAWATPTILYVGAERGITGYCAILAVKAKRDVGSMADMRAL